MGQKLIAAFAAGLLALQIGAAQAATCKDIDTESSSQPYGPAFVALFEPTEYRIEASLGHRNAVTRWFTSQNGTDTMVAERRLVQTDDWKVVAKANIEFSDESALGKSWILVKHGSNEDYKKYCRDINVQRFKPSVSVKLENVVKELTTTKGTLVVTPTIDTEYSKLGIEGAKPLVQIEKIQQRMWNGVQCVDSTKSTSSWHVVQMWSENTRLTFHVDRCGASYRAQVFDGYLYSTKALAKVDAIGSEYNYSLTANGTTYSHPGKEYSIIVPSSLWDSAGPISKKYGTLYKVSPNGSQQSYSIPDGFQPARPFIFFDAKGSYKYRAQLCHVYLGDPTPACFVTPETRVNVLN